METKKDRRTDDSGGGTPAEKARRPVDFSSVTACGEDCAGCGKKRAGACPGCIAADGYVPEWADSGRCRIHACAREHGVRVCALCREFPCARIPELIPWRPDAAAQLSRLREEWLRQGKTAGGGAPGGETAPAPSR